jgi:hypothetical protein
VFYTYLDLQLNFHKMYLRPIDFFPIDFNSKGIALRRPTCFVLNVTTHGLRIILS